MSSSSYPSLGDFVELSQELQEDGRIRGQVRLYNTDNDERVESDAEEFLRRTLTTGGLKKSLRILRDSLSGEDPRGTHLLGGPFGTGKSHQMIVLYHCFNSPSAAANRFSDIEGFSSALPEAATAIPLSLQYSQPDQLWEPFFEELDTDSGSYEEGGFPAIEDIVEAVGDDTVALFIDELERWYNTLDDSKREATKGFLQALLESASEFSNIHVFVSVLQDDSDVHQILNREDSVAINMREEVDVRELIHHRLFKKTASDKSKVQEIVNDYVDAYENSEHVGVSEDLRKRMYESYPFHPDLLDTLEEDYYAQDKNQAARGMLFLLSKVVLAKHDQTDLIIHGDLEPREEVEKDIGTELSHLDDDIHGACVDDIGRVENAGVEYGSRILSTILIYSLRPGKIETIGASKSDIVLGTFHRGDDISDIVRDINRATNGKSWFLHNKGGRYLIRESRTVSALLDNERESVSRKDALAQIKEAIENIFDGGHPVVRDDELCAVPDNKQTKVVISAGEWSEEEVKEVITDCGGGRKYRNTLVFVQPTNSVLESSTVEKARDLEAALRVKRDETVDPELRQDARELADREKRELRERTEIRYGQVLRGDNLLADFDDATPTDFSVLNVDADAESIAEAMEADPFKLRTHIREEALDLLERREEATIVDIYEQFLRRPQLPIPSDADAVLQVIDELRSDPVLVHTDGEGFRSKFRVTSISDRLVSTDAVETWDTADIQSELRQRLKKSIVDFDDFVDEMRTRTDVRLTGDPATAAEQIREADDCVFVSGRETTDRAEGSTLRTDVSIIDAGELADQLRQQIDTTGRARVQEVLAELPDTVVFDDIQQTVRTAVERLLEEAYVIENRYEDTLPAGTNPLGVTLLPTVNEPSKEKILDRIREYDKGKKFSLLDVANDVDERRARTFLLQQLGTGDPAYILEGGSSNPKDWSSGDHFQIPGGSWSFEEYVSDTSELLEKWDSAREEGETTEGSLRFTIPGNQTPRDYENVISIEHTTTTIEMTVTPGQPVMHVTRVFEEMPDSAIDIEARFEFQL